VNRHSRTRAPVGHGRLASPVEGSGSDTREAAGGAVPPLPAECRDDRPPAEGTGEPAPCPDDPGATLRAAREAGGLTIADLTRTTKISSSVLRALEQNATDRLPAPIFTRGFIKAYAQEVGLDPEATADEYLEKIGAAAHPDDNRLSLPRRTVRTDHGPDTRAGAASPTTFPPSWRARGLVAVAALIGMAWVAWMFTPGEARSPADDVGIDAAESFDGDVARAAHTGPGAGDDRFGSVATTPLRFEFALQAPCWISANADGTPVLSRLLQAGERHTIEVDNELVMRIGEPGAVRLSINGEPARPLGRPGEPLNVRITRENFREFLRF
jgi:cytoskeleton protein RodZ